MTKRPAPTPPPAPPPTLRDPWAWACLATIVPLLARCAGAPLGEPVAEDFDFLHRTLFSGMGSLLDGGGSSAFWRPVAHQLYYALLGPLMLSSPRLVAAFHAALLALGTLLVYRALRPRLRGPAAAVAASFPMFSESTRTLVSWPSQFVDVGLYFFSALALHEASRRRLPTALAAALGALLCKEVGLVTLVLLPWFPGAWARAERRRWLGASAALTAAWMVTYLAVRASAQLVLPHGLEGGGAAPWPDRAGWALVGSLRALGSLALRPGPADAWALGLAALPLAALALAAAVRPSARARLAAGRGMFLWGLAWFTLATATLLPIHPHWQPNRSHFGAMGAGIAAAVAIESAHPALLAVVVAGRLALLALAPPAAATITEEAPASGAFMDFAQLSRLQRFMAETRGALAREFPRTPPRTNLLTMNLPRGLIYALGGDRAAQVWYRDSTLRTLTFDELAADSTLPVLAGVQFQPLARRQVVLLPPDAMRGQDQGYRRLRAAQWEASLASLARADSLEPRADHEVFHGNNAGYRALALLQLGRGAEAEREARRSVSLDERDQNGHRVLVSTLLMSDRLDEAAGSLERAERRFGRVRWIESLHASLAAARRPTRRPRRAGRALALGHRHRAGLAWASMSARAASMPGRCPRRSSLQPIARAAGASRQRSV